MFRILTRCTLAAIVARASSMWKCFTLRRRDLLSEQENARQVQYIYFKTLYVCTLNYVSVSTFTLITRLSSVLLYEYSWSEKSEVKDI